MSRYLVTGGAGVIGYEIVRQLLGAGHEVVTVDMGLKGGVEDLTALEASHAGRLTLHDADLAASANVLEGRFDGIFHFAAIVGVRYVSDHPWETIRVNLQSTLNVFQHAIRTRSGPVLFASSSENYASGVDAGFVPVPTPEDVILSIKDVALPRWSYAASKMAGESALFGAAKEGGFTPVVVRFHNVYGPRMGPTHVIPELLERCRAGVDPFPVYGNDQTRSFLHVEDAGRALMHVLRAAEAGEGGIVNVGSSKETVISDLVQVIFDVTGHHPEVDAKPAPPGSVARRAPDVSKLTALGFTPEIELADGIRGCWEALAKGSPA